MDPLSDALNFLQHGAAVPGTIPSPYHAVAFTLCVIGASLGLSLLICFVYQRTHRGMQYSRSFVLSLALLPCIMSVLFMVIGANVARAFGTVGAMSLIRFRSVVKDTVDLAYIFLAITVGLCVGSGNFLIGTTATVALMGIVYIMSKSNFGSAYSHGYILRCVAQTSNGNQSHYAAALEKYGDKLVLLNMHNMQDQTEFVYNVKQINDTERDSLVRELMAVVGVDSVGLVSSTGEVEF